MPSLPSLLPGAAAAEVSPKNPVKDGDVLIVRREGKHPFGDNARHGLRKIYPEENIHEVKVAESCGYAYPRNLMQAGPQGMVLTGPMPRNEPDAQRVECLRKALKAFLESSDLPYRELKTYVNLANVAWYPEKDLLIAINADDATIKYLAQEVYDRPSNILYSATIGLANHELPVKDALGRNACYDLDLAFFSMAIPDPERPGEHKWVALVHEPCFWTGGEILDSDLKSDLKPHSKPPTFSEKLTFLGFKVIPLSRQDMLRLGANAIASTQDERKVLMSDPGISKYLVRKLKEAGVEVELPEETLGSLGTPKHEPYGIHCLTVELVRYEESENLPADHPRTPEKDET